MDNSLVVGKLFDAGSLTKLNYQPYRNEIPKRIAPEGEDMPNNQGKHEDKKISQAKELISAASLILKSKGGGYDRISWLLEDITSEIDNLEAQPNKKSSTSLEKVMDYLDEMPADDTTNSKEANSN